MSCDDLHARVFPECEDINPKEAVLTGFLAFISLTKCNDGGVNPLNVVDY